jgi:hypothetical protein
MKRGFIFLFIIFAYSTLALQIEIISPSNGEILPSNNITFICNVSKSSDNESIANLSLYHNLNGTLSLNKTITSEIVLGQYYVFGNFQNLSSGEYSWYCDASNSTGNYFKTSTSSFTIPSTNKAPIINSYSPTTLNFTLDLYNSTRFSVNASDPNNDTLIVQWSVNGNIKKSEEELWEFGYTPKVPKNFTIRARVSDGDLFTDVIWLVHVPIVNTTTTEQNQTTNTTSQQTNQSLIENITKTTPTTISADDQNITVTKPFCGDGNEDFGENCNNCPQDAGCPEGYNCEEGSCILIEESSNTFLILIVSISFIVFAFITFIIYTKYKEKQIFPSDKELLRGKSTITKKQNKQMPQDFPGVKTQPKLKTQQEKPQIQEQKPIQKVLTKSNLAILRNYINESLKRGKNFNFIKDKLLKVGWTEKQVNEAILSFKNERTNPLQGNKETT